MDRGTQQHTSSPSRAALLDAAGEAMRAQRAAEAAAFFAAADYADAHLDTKTGTAVVGDPIGPQGMWVDDEQALAAVPGGDRWLAYGGPGAPLVSEFAVLELVTAMGLSQDTGRALVGDAIEVRHRLPLIAGRVAAGGVQVWRARRIARATRTLTLEGAGFVDRNLAHVAHSISGAGIDRLVAEASARFDPETTEADRADADAGRFFSIDFRAREALGVHGQVGGTVPVSGELDLADARDLEGAVARGAAGLAALGSGESLDVRRSIAVGELARRQTALDLTGQAQASSVAASTVAARQVVLYVHLSQAALASTSIGIDPLTGGTGIDLATVTAPGIGLRAVTAEQVRDWCRTDGTQVVVKPVIDLNERIATPSYRIPQRLVEQVQLRHPTCRFPYCNRPARASDLDHRVEWDAGGPTASDNLVPLCRLHHRAKTHPTHPGTDPPDGPNHEQHHERRWRYRPTRPDEPPDGFIWTSPHGRRYLVTPTGTTALE
ncbi:DUF222 domain-containing protein [Nocardioides zeae]|uniref:DUF222 domain-containing protein n=1 Tax=Nocardioides imazamoxiresistens TaxID=3231893 RepID=A0ABU3PU91_9ACTN|nr:DUF222 domain-containing protein [Nocardioides zeae]MDT9592795.1 DUF222 domain-containing protein [Nocardioides zeae]